MVPKDIHVLSPRIGEFTALHGSQDFADVTEGKDL
jgi:hypothetical protein